MKKGILLEKDENKIFFQIHGQGVFLFKGDSSPCKFTLWNKDMSDDLTIVCTLSHICIFRKNTLIFSSPTGGLSPHDGGYSWMSLDSQNQMLRFGIGEARLETQVCESKMNHSDKAFLESLMFIQCVEHIVPLRLLRDPIVTATPMRVKGVDEITMDMIGSGEVLPAANLSLEAQQLYNCITGCNFILDDCAFRDFSKAIQYSIQTPGLWCYETLKKKASEFGKPNPDETYLRITLGKNSGESPGVPYVMEIWPAGHYSPIHSHSEANAIIRVLHGSINVSLYPFLCAEKESIQPFAKVDFKKNDVTWISPTLNQIHQLKNITNTVCVTIQCYLYDKSDTGHYDYFDYLDADCQKKQYEPDSDMDFLDFKALMKKEWAARSWC
jgi:hypothetical protein